MPAAWTEDRAPLGSDPSADPGAKTEAGCHFRHPVWFAYPKNFGIGTRAINPGGVGGWPPLNKSSPSLFILCSHRFLEERQWISNQNAWTRDPCLRMAGVVGATSEDPIQERSSPWCSS